MMNKALRTALLALVSTFLIFSCAKAPQSDQGKTRSFRLGLIPGAQSFVDFVMQGHGILDQFGLRSEKTELINPPTLHLMIAERQVDIGFAGFTTMAAARSEGKDLIVIHGVFSPVNMVFVAKDSPIKSLRDLKGKKLGVFGGPGSTTFVFLAVLAKKWNGIDLFKEVELVTAPGPALIELLRKGEVAAALLGTTESIQMFAQQRYRVLMDLSEEYKTHQGGRAPAHVTIATSEKFAGASPDIVRDYLKAYEATVAYIKAHPEVWEEYAKSINVTNPEETELLQQKMLPNIVDKWDHDQIAVQKDYLNLVHEIVGDSVLKVVPDDLIRNEYNP